MKIVSEWQEKTGISGISKFYEVEVRHGRFVTVKKIIGEDGRTNFAYVMDNEDGTTVHDENGNAYNDAVDEKAVVRFIQGR